MQDPSDGVGRGVIAGEVHDCEGKVLKNISVVSTCLDDSAKLIYTIGEDCDQPDRSRSTSGECGTYAVLNATPGLHKIEAWYKDGSGATLLGSGYVHVFADTVSIFTPEGLDPLVGAVDAGTPVDAAADVDATVDVDAAMTADAAVEDATVEDATVEDI